jgi:hypothetical protein
VEKEKLLFLKISMKISQERYLFLIRCSILKERRCIRMKGKNIILRGSQDMCEFPHTYSVYIISEHKIIYNEKYEPQKGQNVLCHLVPEKELSE